MWRYRLGDLVECDGFCGITPTLRFLGRAGNVSDLCGEKLSEPFVVACLADLWPSGVGRPAVAFLRPCRSAISSHGYVLVVGSPVDDALAERLDHSLRRNPHYDLARRLGQLRLLRIRVDPSAGGLENEPDHRRLGDIKPLVLEARMMSRETGESASGG